MIFVIVACLAGVVPTLPQWNELKKIEAELAEVEEKEKKFAADRKRYASEEEALRSNPEYMEARARDRLHLHRSGETIINIVE